MRDSLRRDDSRLRQCTDATEIATATLHSLEQEQQLPFLRIAPTAPPRPLSRSGSTEPRRAQRTYAAAAAPATSSHGASGLPPQPHQAPTPPAPTLGFALRDSGQSWLPWTLRQLSGKYLQNNVLRASESAWDSLTLPINNVIVPFLRRRGQLLNNDPGALTLERLVSYLQIGSYS